MPAESQAQSRYLNWRFGHDWVKQHHFDNSPKGLPQHLARGSSNIMNPNDIYRGLMQGKRFSKPLVLGAHLARHLGVPSPAKPQTSPLGLAQGTDTVPAMLTPGEAVLNRGAASMPGVRAGVAYLNRLGQGRGTQLQGYASGSPMIKPSHRGLLHRHLGIPQGQHIPAARITAALHSPSPTIRKEANFARNFGHAQHYAGGTPNVFDALSGAQPIQNDFGVVGTQPDILKTFSTPYGSPGLGTSGGLMSAGAPPADSGKASGGLPGIPAPYDMTNGQTGQASPPGLQAPGADSGAAGMPASASPPTSTGSAAVPTNLAALLAQFQGNQGAWPSWVQSVMARQAGMGNPRPQGLG
jgi:hypothetical protein